MASGNNSNQVYFLLPAYNTTYYLLFLINPERENFSIIIFNYSEQCNPRKWKRVEKLMKQKTKISQELCEVG